MRKKLFFLLLPSILLISNCATANYNTVMEKAEKKLYEEDKPLEASRELIPQVNKKGPDQLLFMMEAGSMLHLAKEYEKSNKILQAADIKADNMYKSISKEVAAFITNETGKDYMGEDYERILLNMTIGINYLMLEDYENAQVEFKKVNTKLDYIQQKSGNSYNINLMALYLSATAHSATGEYEYAYVDLRKIHELRPGIPFVGQKLMELARILDYKDDIAKWKRLYPASANVSAKGKGEVVLVYENGRSPRKASRGKLLEDPEVNRLFNVAVTAALLTSGSAARTISNEMVLMTVNTAEHPIPKYVLQKYHITTAEAVFSQNNKQVAAVRTTILNDVENTIQSNFEAHYMKIRQKMLARLATKAVAALVTKEIAEQSARSAGGRNSGIAGFLVGTIVGVGVGAALFSVEKPDLRCWHTIPADYQTGFSYLLPGEYDVKINYYDPTGNLIFQEDYGKVTVKENLPTVINFQSYY